MNKKILVVDDSKLNGNLLKAYLGEYDLESIHAFNGQAALEILEERHNEIACITLDRQMPVMDGIECAKIIKENEDFKDIPIIFVSSMGEKEDILEGLNVGVYDYIPKPVDPDFLYLKVKYAIEYYEQKQELRRLNKRISTKNNRLEKIVEARTLKLQQITNAILNILEKATSINDEVTGNHTQRVAEYSALLSERANLSQKQIRDIKNYAPLHDIGKLGIPENILKKPGPLTPEEFDEMKTHVSIGADLLKTAELPEIALNIIKYHHEKWCGKGYLEGLQGDNIPIEARVVAIADVFDALTTERPYKKAFSVEKAIEIMTKDMTGSFDPVLLDLFFGKMDEIYEIKKRLEDRI